MILRAKRLAATKPTSVSSRKSQFDGSAVTIKTMKQIAGLGLILGLFAVTGCGTPVVPLTQGGFFSPDPAARLYAIRQAGSQRDQDAIAPLIELLDSDDPAERLLCIAALERITGKRLGYNPYARPAKRVKQIQAWVHAYQNGSLDTP